MTKAARRRRGLMGLWFQRVGVHDGGARAWLQQQLGAHISNCKQKVEKALSK